MAATVTHTASLPARAVRSRPAVRELARMVTGLLLFVPLAAAILEIGRPSLMLTLSGLAALHLAVEIFLDRIGKPISEEQSLRTVLVTWVAGLALAGAAAWAGSESGYHLEPVVAVGVAAGCLIGLVCPAPLAALWGVAGTAAVAMGVAMVAPLTVEAGVAAVSVVAGTYSGAIVGFALERSMDRRRRPVAFNRRRSRATRGAVEGRPAAHVGRTIRPIVEKGLSNRALTLVWLAGVGLCLAASSLSASNGRPPEVFLPVGISGAVYVTSGFLVARQRSTNRIGYALILIGAVPASFVILRYLFPAFVIASDPVGALAAILLAYVLLSFPSGNVAGRAERVTMTAMTAYFVLYGLAVAFSLEPEAHGVSRCPPCVPNPLRITDLSVFPVVRTLGDLGVVASAVAVAVLSVRRWYLARGAARRVLAPVLFGGLVTAAGFVTTSLAILTGGGSNLTGQIMFMLQILVPIGLAVTFVRVYVARGAVASAIVQLGASPSNAALEAALRQAVGDPELQVARWSPAAGGYLDREGRRVDLDDLDKARAALRMERDGQPLAAVVHDAALAVDPALVESVADAVRFAVDTTEMRDRLQAMGGDASNLPRGEVAFLFGDVEGSTNLLAAVGDAYIGILEQMRRIVREAADRGGGRVVDMRADECFLAFSDPASAMRTAVDIQQRLAAAAWSAGKPRMRIGLHHGTPELTPDGYVGLDVHLAARVMATAEGDQIVASAAVVTAVGGHLPDGVSAVPVGYVTLKGIAEPEFMYRIVSASTG